MLKFIVLLGMSSNLNQLLDMPSNWSKINKRAACRYIRSHLLIHILNQSIHIHIFIFIYIYIYIYIYGTLPFPLILNPRIEPEFWFNRKWWIKYNNYTSNFATNNYHSNVFNKRQNINFPFKAKCFFFFGLGSNEDPSLTQGNRKRKDLESNQKSHCHVTISLSIKSQIKKIKDLTNRCLVATP